jgi:hypothetical protein
MAACGRFCCKSHLKGGVAATPDSARQRLASPASPSPKPREVKDYSGGAGKPDLRGTAWWGRQDSM